MFQTLLRSLHEVLPQASLSAVTLPLSRPLSLLLLEAEGLDRPYSWEEMERIMAEPPHWAFCWASGRALAARLLREPEMLRGKRVVDVGCGSGVVAIAAALSGAERVIACDRDPVALEAALYNARLNGVDILACRDLEEAEPSLDLVLAADILYDRENFPLLDRFLEMAPLAFVADSRVKDLRWPRYTLEEEATVRTLPDLGEPKEHARVQIHCGERDP